MYGIYGMEGNGPRGGTPQKMNILLFSQDPIALDATVCRLVDLNPEYVPTIKYGMKAGTGTYLENEDKSDIPIYNYDDCIRCFCCQEICPESAIKLKTPILRKIINLF